MTVKRLTHGELPYEPYVFVDDIVKWTDKFMELGLSQEAVQDLIRVLGSGKAGWKVIVDAECDVVALVPEGMAGALQRVLDTYEVRDTDD